MPESERVEFHTRDGITLRDDFFQADGAGRAIVVMAGGFSLLKELLGGFADAFRQAGVSALAYDHRSFGSSDGEPRQEVDIDRQAADFHDAVTAAMRLPRVDAAKVVLWSIGHGASAAMIAAGRDPRLAATILCVPFPSGTIDRTNIPDHLIEAAWRERESMALTGVDPTYAKVFRDWSDDVDGDNATVFIGGSVGYDMQQGNAALALKTGTPWRNEVTLLSFLNVEHAETQDHAYKIRHKTLYIVNEDDPLAAPPDVHRLVAARMGRADFKAVPKRPGEGLMQQLDHSVRPQLAWLREVLS